MSDETEKLRAAMRAAPTPAPKARKDAFEAAMRAFDEEFSETPQESAAPARLTSRKQSFGSRLMTMLNHISPRRGAFLGGASLAALSLATFAIWRDAPPALIDPAPPAPTVAEVAAPQAAARMQDKNAPINHNVRTRMASPAAADGGSAPAAGALVDIGEAPALIAPAPQYEPGFAQPENRGRFTAHDANPVKLVAEAPVSTFSVDVDTASYAVMRRWLNAGAMPDPASVRTEELINYFPYDYPAPESADRPFSVKTTVMDAPWAKGRKLLEIGLRADLPAERRRANLTFLIDTSGSMAEQSKLPLLITSLRLMLDGLRPDDTVAIVTYAGSSTIALEPTKAAERRTILDALERLAAGGGTAGAEGIETAYRLAEDRFDPEAVNRVILATDGDFNIGPSSDEAMEALIERKRDSGVYLSVLGFGLDNLNDAAMQVLAQAGNGQAAYIDTLSEARKTLVDELSSMVPVAGDVKIQVEFNPALVADYRLIGYESRALAREDFNNDKVDAGEIGAGHRVTAIYEYTPVGGDIRVDPLRYATETATETGAANDANEIAFLRLRWKTPGEGESRLAEVPFCMLAGAP
ncbi:MAG: von Willebrand factor type A domain-containing protein, partial [Pikeienuella sp.]